MFIRRNTALALSALLLAAPALSSCGFNYATDIDYTPAVGVHNRDASVDVLGAVIVSGQPDSGTLIASFVNNNQTETATFDFLAGARGNSIQPQDFAPLDIEPASLVNLATDGGIVITGTFQAGEFVPLTIGLTNGERITIKVPVVEESGDFAGLDDSEPTTTPSE